MLDQIGEEIEDLRLDPDSLPTPLEGPRFGVELVFSKCEAPMRVGTPAYRVGIISQQVCGWKRGGQSRSKTGPEMIKNGSSIQSGLQV